MRLMISGHNPLIILGGRGPCLGQWCRQLLLDLTMADEQIGQIRRYGVCEFVTLSRPTEKGSLAMAPATTLKASTKETQLDRQIAVAKEVLRSEAAVLKALANR
jgi:hypothetical protein